MMSLKVLHAGDGYAYLTRQVASGDNARTRGELLADYYTAHGAPAGQWWGKGAAELGVAGEVTEEQMQAAYGEFLHPDANEKLKELLAAGSSIEAALDEVRLGRKAQDFNKDNAFLAAVKQQTIEFTQANSAVPTPEQKEDIERIVARRMLTDIDAGVGDAHNRFDTDTALSYETLVGADADEFLPDNLGTEDLAVRHSAPITSERIRAFIAQAKRDARYPVAGFDMVFTPAKSISVLWGIGDERTRKAIMKAHSEAVESSLQWIENNAVFTRSGAQGQEKIDCEGATVAKFVHFDNRSGDPNLHTHCAMLNRVPCADGTYRTIDSKVIHRATVTGSEHYNQRVTELVARYLDVEFEPVVKSRGGRPVWEIKGIPEPLMKAMSRRDDVMERGRELIAEYRKTYGRTPPKSVQHRLMDQATLETRNAKGDPRSLEEMVTEWRKIADTVSDDFTRESVIEDVFTAAESYRAEPEQGASHEEVLAYIAQQKKRRVPYSPDDDTTIVSVVMDTLSRERSTWTEYQITSEVSRQMSRYIFDNDTTKAEATERISETCLKGQCVNVDSDSILPGVDVDSKSPRLFRANGESIYRAHATKRFTSQAVLDDEKVVTDAAKLWVVNDHTPEHAREAAAEIEAKKGFTLTADKATFVEHLLCSPAVLAAGLGPAGTGKTTAMEVFARAYEKTGHKVVGLAPSAVAAAVLGDTVGINTGTLAQFIDPAVSLSGHGLEVSEGDVILVDEAGMASTRDLAQLIRSARERGAVVRMVGDPQQLAAVESGGMLGEVAEITDAPVLTEINRFTDPREAEVSMKLRDGETSVIDWYISHGRVDAGLREELPGRVFNAWHDSIKQGKSALMIAGDRHTVDALNQMARTSRVDAGLVTPEAGEASISAGRVAAVGDTVVTRANNSKLRYGKNRKNRVKNGDLWTVTGVTDSGELMVTHSSSGHKVTLPADYVTENVELGYASTIHRSQGMTVDRSYVIPSASLDRQGLYVALSRGREVNKVFLADDQLPDVDSHLPPEVAMSPRDLFASIIERDGAAVTAHAAIAAADAEAFDVHTVVAAYTELAEELAVDVVCAAASDETDRSLLRGDWQTRRLAEHIGRMDAAGVNTDRVLAEAIATAHTRWNATAVDERGSFAFLVRMAIEDLDASKAVVDEDLLWTVDAPMPVARESEQRRRVLGDEELHDFVCSTYAVVQEHLASAGDRAVEQVPVWTAHIGPHRPTEREYHAVWCATVRDFAAAIERDPSIVTDEQISKRDHLPRRLRRGLDAVEAAGNRRGRADDFFDRMIDVEARAYISTCTENVTTLRARRERALDELTAAQDYPRWATVRADRERTRQLATQIAEYTEVEDAHRGLARQCQDARNAVRLAEKSGRIGRSKRVADAQDELDQLTVRLDALTATMETLAAELPGPAERFQVQLDSDNLAQWDRKEEQAFIADEKAIDAATAKIRRAEDQESLWSERAEITEAVLEARKPASREQINKYMADLHDTLAAKRAERSSERAQHVENPSTPTGEGETTQRTNPVLAEWRRKRKAAKSQQAVADAEKIGTVAEQFRHVQSVVTTAGAGSAERVSADEPQPVDPSRDPATDLFAYSTDEQMDYLHRSGQTQRNSPALRPEGPTPSGPDNTPPQRGPEL